MKPRLMLYTSHHSVDVIIVTKFHLNTYKSNYRIFGNTYLMTLPHSGQSPRNFPSQVHFSLKAIASRTHNQIITLIMDRETARLAKEDQK